MSQKISVIMPAYNAEKYIKKSMESILNQSFKDFELIVVNDGSTDSTEEIVKSFADERVRCVYKKNGGLVNSYKFGIEIAKGKYVTFCDSDDTYSESFLEKAYNDIEKYNCDFCSYQYRIINTSTNKLSVHKNFLHSGYYSKEMQNQHIRPCLVFNSFDPKKMYIVSATRWNKIYKTELLKKIITDLDEACVQLEDNVFTSLVLLNSNSFYIDNSFCAYYYLQLAESMSNGYKGEKTFRRYIYAIDKLKSILDKYNYSGPYRQLNYLAYDSARIVFRRCAKYGSFKDSKELIKAIRKDEYVSQVRFSELRAMKNIVFHILFKMRLYLPLYLIFRWA